VAWSMDDGKPCKARIHGIYRWDVAIYVRSFPPLRIMPVDLSPVPPLNADVPTPLFILATIHAMSALSLIKQTRMG
jgi:hypothetical protein